MAISFITCPPSYIEQLMQAEDRLAPFDPAAIDEDAPPEVIAKLLRLPYFRQAYEFSTACSPTSSPGSAPSRPRRRNLRRATRKTV